MIGRNYKLHTRSNKDGEYAEQFKDTEEFVIRMCERDGIDWTRLTSIAEKAKLAEKYGCLQEWNDSIYGKKSAVPKKG